MELEAFAEQLLADHHATVGTYGQDDDIRYCALALAGEAGELANIVKKEWRDRLNMVMERKMEAADVLVYVLLLTKASGWSVEELLEMAHFKHERFMEKWNVAKEDRGSLSYG